MPTNHFDERIAAIYDETSGDRFDPAVLDPTVEFLVEQSAGGRVVEFASGTGRVALPLARRGVEVRGIELSAAIADRMRAKPDAQRVPVTIGDMTTCCVGDDFALAFLVFNTINNLTSQDEQVACFRNAAAHLRPGGRFVVEVGVPDLQRLPPGERFRAFDVTPTHLGFDEYDVALCGRCDHSAMNSSELHEIGLVHPGSMGSSIGAALVSTGRRVVWASAGRSEATCERAERAGLVDVGEVAEVARRAEVIISVCPPGAARAVAQQVADGIADRQDRPLYVDANAVSPTTVQSIADLLGADQVVDGGIIGPAAWKPGTTTLWLAGAAAPAVAGLFAGSPVEARVLDAQLGAASGLKACFALHSKALPTIWLAMAQAAAAFGVADALHEQLGRFGVDFDAELDRLVAKAAGKSWRWIAEMDEAGDALAGVDLPDGFSRAAAQMYRLMAERNGRPEG